MEKEFKTIESVKFLTQSEHDEMFTDDNLLKEFKVEGKLGDRVNNKYWCKFIDIDSLTKLPQLDKSESFKFVFKNSEYMNEMPNHPYQVIEVKRDWDFTPFKLCNYIEMNHEVTVNDNIERYIVGVKIYKDNYVYPSIIEKVENLK